MNNKPDDFSRNRPSDEGVRNDPNIRDESAQEPGVNTMSSSKTDDDNKHITKTATDDFTNTEFGKNADKRFDEVDNEDENS